MNTSHGKGTPKSASILIIEDDRDWLRILARACENAGYNTRRADNFDKAVSLLTKETFDAVIVDIRLKNWQDGNREGLEALAAVPAEHRPAALVLSAFADYENTRLAFKDFEVIDVIRKSEFDAKEFLPKLKQAVRATRKTRRVAGE
jgi:DNA-binding response OmpR family regulator